MVRSTFASEKTKTTSHSKHFWKLRCRKEVHAVCTKHLMFGPLLERYIFRGRRSTRDMFIRDVGRSGRRFPDRGCILEHQIFRFAKVILRDRCSTSYDLASLFRGRHSTFRQMQWKNHKTRWYKAVSSALNFPFLKDVSRNCFVFDVVNLEN